MPPEISVIVPVFQVEKYIESSINSIINQSFSSYELILVNDGTIDKSIEIALTALSQSNIKYTVINQKNTGVSAARNAGIKISSAVWVVCIDPDDVVAPDFLERLYHVGLKYKTDVVFCDYQEVNDINVFKKSSIKAMDFEISQGKVLKSFLTRKLKLIAPGLLIKKEFIEMNNIWYDQNIKFSEDQHFIWRVLLSTPKVAFVKDKLYNYLLRPNSTMTSSKIDKILTGFVGFKKLKIGIHKKSLIKDFILPRWVFSVLKVSTRILTIDEFSELANKLEYKKMGRSLLFFPDLRISLLSLILIIDEKLFYRLGHKFF